MLLAVAAWGCARRQATAEDRTPQAAPPSADLAAQEQQLRAEYDAVRFQQHVVGARKALHGGDPERALAEAGRALEIQPTSDEALQLRDEALRALGERAQRAPVVIADQYAAYQVKREEQKVAVRKHLAAGRTDLEDGDFEQAKRELRTALFIVQSARLSPVGTDAELAALGAETEAAYRTLERREAEARAARDQQDTAAALAQAAAVEEQQLLEARSRRARLLQSAIDRFNREEFEDAERLADQVLREEPDNTVARDLVVNARRARHETLGRRYLAELKETYRRWQVDIEETKVPSAKILHWPSQSFWDRISELRARRDVPLGADELTPEGIAVRNALDARQISLPFEATPFPQVVDYLSAVSGINFVIDPRSREDLDAVEITLDIRDVTVKDALDLIMLQAGADGTIVYEIVGNVVRFIKKEYRKKNQVLRIHPIADLTLGLTDFIPPEITQLGADEDTEVPLFGGQAEEAPQPYGTAEDLMELVRTSVAPQTWEEGGIMNVSGHNLVVLAPPPVQNEIARFLDDLRQFTHIVITIESRFLALTDAFLRDVGVDFRGLGGTNGGPLAVLDDVTSGLVNNTSAGFDNGSPGVNAGGAALPPSSGLFFNDGSDGDFRARTENMFTNPLGQLLTALGGGTFQATYIDDVAVSVIVRATEKSLDARELTSATVTAYNTQRAYLSSVAQISFVQDFDVDVAQTAFIADPVIGVIQEGLALDVRPTVSNDRQYVTLQVRPTVVDLVTPIATFTTLLGQAAAISPIPRPPTLIPVSNPVSIQLPEITVRRAEATVRVPDGGSLVIGGLKKIRVQDSKATTLKLVPRSIGS